MCIADFILYLGFSNFNVLIDCFSRTLADHGEQDGLNPAGRAAGEEELEGSCCGDHRGGCRGNRPWKCFTLCMFTPNIIKAVREKMGEAMNATVSNLDLSDVSDKTILFVAIGTGEKSCN